MRYAERITAGLLALAILGQAGSAEQPSPGDKVDRKAIDAALYDTLREVINKGADMYNNGDMTGCYRLFEGALLTAKPMLGHRPELQKSMAKALTAADRDAVTFRRAFALRAALDKVRAELNPNPKKDKLPQPDPEEKKEVKKPDPEVKKPEVKKPDPEGKKPDPEGKKPDVKKPEKDDGKDDVKEKLPAPKSEPDAN
jgi:hypothetical protein